MEQLTDEELVRAYRERGGSPKGDAWLNELIQRYHSRVALWCFRLTGDREAAADLAQEVFLKVFRNLDSFRGDAKFSTWLYSITRNHCFNELKSRSTRPENTGDPILFDLPDGAEGIHSSLEREGASHLLRELLAASALDATETQVMTMHFAEELPLDAITRLLKLNNASGAKAYIVSAKRKLNRAVQRLKIRPGRFGTSWER